MIRILIVEDEKPIANLIDMNLTSLGYRCSCVYDGLAAADQFEENQYDLVLLDIMLPGADGYDLMEYIAPTKTPVIFITAKGSVNDRVKGLRAGADDYLVKPFEIVELIARVEAVLRRTGKLEEKLEVDGVTVDTRSRIVYCNGTPVPLTMKEYELLVLFIRNKNIALFRDSIYQRVWSGDEMGDSRTVDLHVQRLRKKLRWQDKIVSVYKVGYRLEAER